MEEKLLKEFEDYCKWRCPYKDCKYQNGTLQLNGDNWQSCEACGSEGYVNVEIEINPCEYCQIEGFIREIRDSL